MQWQFTPYALPLFVGTGILLSIAILAWQRRKSLGLIYLFWLCVLLVFSVLGYAFEMGSVSVEQILFWFKVEYIGIASLPTVLLMLVLSYIGYQHYLNSLTYLALLVIPATTLSFVWTNELHEMMWADITLMQFPNFTGATFIRGPWYWVQLIYSYLLIIVIVALLIRAISRTSGRYRRQLGMLLLGTLTPTIAVITRQIGLISLEFDLVPYSLVITVIILALGMFQYQLFDLMPIARDMVIESMDDAVIVLDQQNRIIDLNPAMQRLIRQSTADIIGQPITKAFPNQHNLIARYNDAQEADIEIVVGEGRAQRHFDLHISTLFRHKKQISGRLIVLRDITERIQMENQRIELKLEKERAQILAGFIEQAGHEFKTPLSIINASIYMLGRLSDKEKQTQQRGRIQDQVNNIDRLVDDLIIMARLDGNTQLTYDHLQINPITQVAVNDLKPLIEKKKLLLQLLLDDTLPTIIGNSDYLKIALQNIIDNAVSYTPEEGEIKVRTYAKDANIVIEVSDSGMGMNKEELEHIFNRFYRAEKAYTTRGFGLGLPIAEKIIKMHRGYIEVDSEKGTGSTFWVMLPAGNKSPTSEINELESS